MCDSEGFEEEVSGFNQLNVLFGKEVRCVDCARNGQCSCGKKD